MKKLAAVALGLLISIGAYAQHEDRPMRDVSPETRAEKMTERMVEKLKLMDDQKAAVYEANLVMAKESQASKENRKAIVAQHDASLKKTLSEEQYASYIKAKQELREKRKGRMPKK